MLLLLVSVLSHFVVQALVNDLDTLNVVELIIVSLHNELVNKKRFELVVVP